MRGLSRLGVGHGIIDVGESAEHLACRNSHHRPVTTFAPRMDFETVTDGQRVLAAEILDPIGVSAEILCGDRAHVFLRLVFPSPALAIYRYSRMVFSTAISGIILGIIFPLIRWPRVTMPQEAGVVVDGPVPVFVDVAVLGLRAPSEVGMHRCPGIPADRARVANVCRKLYAEIGCPFLHWSAG